MGGYQGRGNLNNSFPSAGCQLPPGGGEGHISPVTVTMDPVLVSALVSSLLISLVVTLCCSLRILALLASNKQQGDLERQDTVEMAAVGQENLNGDVNISIYTVKDEEETFHPLNKDPSKSEGQKYSNNQDTSSSTGDSVDSSSMASEEDGVNVEEDEDAALLSDDSGIHEVASSCDRGDTEADDSDSDSDDLDTSLHSLNLTTMFREDHQEQKPLDPEFKFTFHSVDIGANELEASFINIESHIQDFFSSSPSTQRKPISSPPTTFYGLLNKLSYFYCM